MGGGGAVEDEEAVGGGGAVEDEGPPVEDVGAAGAEREGGAASGRGVPLRKGRGE